MVAYAQSKTANVCFTIGLHERFHKEGRVYFVDFYFYFYFYFIYIYIYSYFFSIFQGIHSYAVHPGVINTELGRFVCVCRCVCMRVCGVYSIFPQIFQPRFNLLHSWLSFHEVHPTGSLCLLLLTNLLVIILLLV